MKAIWGFPRISVRGINKTKRKLGFALMALTIRKVATQRVKLIKNIIKRQFLYNFNRNCLYSYPGNLCPELFLLRRLMH